MHLMDRAVKSLRSKDIEISKEEEIGTLLAILLHDIGHGPFSHSLEHSILTGVNHEHISSVLMHQINRKMDGKLSLAIEIFENRYYKKFLHQLVSSQLDMDRLDYLRRDSFYTGVSEGTVGIERIIQMLNVKDNCLIVDQKGIYSVEKFLMARRFMYWQVYLHKTSIAADYLMLNILKRAKEMIASGTDLFASPFLLFFLSNNFSKDDLKKEGVLSNFCNLDDNEIIGAIKVWQTYDDITLSTMCRMLIDRDLPKIEIFDTKISSALIQEKTDEVCSKLGINPEEASYFVNTGNLSNNAYSIDGDSLKIGMKDGSLKELSETSEIYNLAHAQKPQIKYFITSIK
jgi:HD superfamily phosphohydrolase